MTGLTPQRVALVTGANRGLGLEVSRQLAEQGLLLWLGVRDLRKGEQAVQVIGRQARPLESNIARASVADELETRFALSV